MSTYATYTDAIDFSTNSGLNVETATLLGMNTTLAGTGAVQGATTLQVASTTGAPASPTTFQAYILDGLNSETCLATTTDATHLSVPAGTLAAHAAGVSVSSAGSSGGCLADSIIRASRMLENICKQGPDGSTDRSLYAVARTDKLAGPNSFRANFDPDGTLLLRPYHWPVTSVTSVSVAQGAQTPQAVNLTYLVLPDAARQIEIPQAQVLNTAPPIFPFYGVTWARNWGFVATVAYTGGPIATAALTSVPDDIRQACHLIVAHFLGYRRNPTGAAMVRLGDSTLEARLRGESVPRSLLLNDAYELLAPYTQRGGW